MYVLIMVILMGAQGVNVTHLYYENQSSCEIAAKEFIAHEKNIHKFIKPVKFSAFCVRGDQ